MPPPSPDRPAHRIVGRILFEEAQGPLSISRFDLSRDVTAHDHDFLEVVLIGGGRATHQTLYGKRSLGRGDLLVIRPGFWHAYLECRRLIVWNCCIAPGLLEQIRWADPHHDVADLLWVGGLGARQHGMMQTRLADPVSRAAVSQLRKLQRTTPGTLVRAGKLLIFLDLVVGALRLGRAGSRHVDRIHPAVRRVLTCMEADLAHDWTLSELARIAGLARAYLVRLFRQQAGASPIELLNRLRCERAAGLLLSTDLTVAEVATQLGWFDPGYFTRRFRTQFGQSPSAYRQAMRR